MSILKFVFRWTARRDPSAADDEALQRRERRRRRRERMMRRAQRSASKTAPVVTAPGFETLFRRAETSSDVLVVVLSPTTNFAFFRHDFERDVLHVSDPKQNYYLVGSRELSEKILETMAAEGHRKLIFIGSSKGGFGALLLGLLCAELRPDLPVRVLAFSPQVRLYPDNPNLAFRSYHAVQRRLLEDADLSEAFETLGDVRAAGERPNLCATVVFAREAAGDRAEAESIRGPNVALHMVEGSHHGSAFHFMSKGQTREALEERVRKVYARPDDEDLDQTKPEDFGAFVDMLVRSALMQPSLNEMIERTLAQAPGPVAGAGPENHAQIQPKASRTAPLDPRQISC